MDDSKIKKTKDQTSWGGVAHWYDSLLESGDGTYQKDLILPSVLRLVSPSKEMRILDLACGQGFFSRELAESGAVVTAVDISKELIALAKGKDIKNLIDYHVARAHDLGFIKNETIDKIVCILALQNIENIHEVFRECFRVLAPDGDFIFVINHPAFRIPRESYWVWDDLSRIQYRRIDRYLSESKAEIEMHPGGNPSQKTVSFHRPIQYYFKALRKAGFTVTNLEEWNSHKESGKGPRKAAEDRARKEIPLFLCLIAKKLVLLT